MYGRLQHTYTTTDNSLMDALLYGFEDDYKIGTRADITPGGPCIYNPIKETLYTSKTDTFTARYK